MPFSQNKLYIFYWMFISKILHVMHPSNQNSRMGARCQLLTDISYDSTRIHSSEPEPELHSLTAPAPTKWYSSKPKFMNIAMLQSTQHIINAHYNQRLITLLELTTNMRLIHVWRTFPTVITTSVVQDLKEKIAGVDCMMRWLSIALHVS
jgi:hypothetical protein